MSNLSKKIIYLLLLALFFVGVSNVHAQGVTIKDGAISLESNPTFPAPGDTVQVVLDGVLIDTRGATITWLVDGTIVERGVGIESISFKAGAVGTIHEISVAVIPESGGIVRKTLNISPADVDLIWEAESFVPPFYKGKSLRGPQGPARIIAIPNIIDSAGRRVPREELIYTWKFNNKVMGNASGYGRFAFVNDVSPRENTIGVEVSLQDGTLVSREEITIRNADPVLRFYVNDPLLGVVLDSALGNAHSFDDKEISIAAYPYFMATQKDILEYSWELNGEPIRTRESLTNFVTLGKQEDASGRVSLSVEVDHPSKAFQFVRKKLDLVFRR